MLGFLKFQFFSGPRSLRKLVSGNPQYEKPQRELLRWSGARDRQGAPQILEGVKSPFLKYLPKYPLLTPFGRRVGGLALAPFK